jgi:hypothetical protein
VRLADTAHVPKAKARRQAALLWDGAKCAGSGIHNQSILGLSLQRPLGTQCIRCRLTWSRLLNLSENSACRTHPEAAALRQQGLEVDVVRAEDRQPVPAATSRTSVISPARNGQIWQAC